MPSRAAVARSITSEALQPLVLLVGVDVDQLRDACAASAAPCGAHCSSSLRCRRPAACTGTARCPARPPTRRSCTGCRKRLAPGSCESFGRRRAIIWSAVTLPALVEVLQRHEHARRVVAAGEGGDRSRPRGRSGRSRRAARAGCCIAWKELDWSADDRAVQPAGVLLREEALRHDDVEVDAGAHRRERDQQRQRLVAQHPARATARSRARMPVEAALARLVEPAVLLLRRARCRSLAHIIGVVVSETTIETAMATERITANSRNRRPTMPPISRMGMNTAISEMLIVRHGEADLRGALAAPPRPASSPAPGSA